MRHRGILSGYSQRRSSSLAFTRSASATSASTCRLRRCLAQQSGPDVRVIRHQGRVAKPWTMRTTSAAPGWMSAAIEPVWTTSAVAPRRRGPTRGRIRRSLSPRHRGGPSLLGFVARPRIRHRRRRPQATIGPLGRENRPLASSAVAGHDPGVRGRGPRLPDFPPATPRSCLATDDHVHKRLAHHQHARDRDITCHRVPPCPWRWIRDDRNVQRAPDARR